jgi:hypothetical protein
MALAWFFCWRSDGVAARYRRSIVKIDLRRDFHRGLRPTPLDMQMRIIIIK